MDKQNENIKTYNVKLCGEQQFTQHWLNLLSHITEAYNCCSLLIKENNIPLSLVPIHNQCYDILRDTFPMLPSQFIIRIQKEVLRAYKSKKSNKHKGEMPQKHNLSVTLDKRLYSNFTTEGISMISDTPNKRKRFTFKLYPKIQEMLNAYVATDPVIFARNNELYLSIPFRIQGRMPQNDECIGIDMGMKRLFVTSEGLAFKDKDYLSRRRRVRYLKSRLKSKNTKSAKRHLKKLSRKERNLSKDMCHRAVNTLLKSTRASVLVMEDLEKIKEKTKKTKEGHNRKKHNNMFSQVPLYLFKEILTYKAQLVGKRVETVSPMYTSQTDCRTNKRDGKRLGCRFLCSDGKVMDADWNAAVNIAQKSSHPLTMDVMPYDGRLIIFNGREQSTSHTLNEQ